MKYEVEIPEVHYATWTIEADTKEEAIEIALRGEGDEMELRYSHTLEEARAIIHAVKEIK